MAFLGDIAAGRTSLRPAITTVRERDGTRYELDVHTGHPVQHLPAATADYGSHDRDIPTWRFCAPSKGYVDTKLLLQPARDFQTSELTFVTYNVWFDSRYQRERALLLFKVLQRCKATIVCLQEVTPFFLNLLLAQPWCKEDWYLTDCSRAMTVQPYGVIIMSRIPMDRAFLRYMPSNMGRSLLVADFTINGRKVRVSTVHLESLNNQEIRLLQLQTALPLFTEEHCDDVFFMGDMNFADRCREEQMLPAAGLADTWQLLHGTEPMTTLPDGAGRYDRILFRSNFTPASIELLGTRREEIEDVFVAPSDHYGLHAMFRLQS